VVGIEDRSSVSDVIVVQPEAGEWGFYTDWLDESIAQKWETYHLTQLVPFIDRNLRTIADKAGRGIIGFSMGGLGAMRYAADRPDLFAAATTLSGIVDLDNGAVQIGVTGMLAAAKLDVAGAFGAIGVSPVWGQVNPTSHVDRLATVQVAIYVGKGTDIAEATTASASATLTANLDAAKIPHYYENYGVPGDTPDGNCNGGHNNECARYSSSLALPRLRAALANPQ
jgi:S-formylglutathione hydrolase FrmB